MRSTQLKTEMKRNYVLVETRGVTRVLWKGDKPPSETDLKSAIRRLTPGFRLSYQCNFSQEIIVE